MLDSLWQEDVVHLSLLASLAVTFLVLLLGACCGVGASSLVFGCSAVPASATKKHVDTQKICSDESCTADMNNADLCWAQKFGEYKFSGLRSDPLSSNIPKPVYSLEPLPLPLPQLSSERAAALEDLSQRIKKRFPRDYRTDPGTLVRYLRARQWNVQKAENFFAEAVAFWEEHGLRDTFSTWSLEAYEHCLAPWWLSGGLLGHGLKGEPLAYERLPNCRWSVFKDMLPWEDILKLDVVHCLRSLAALEEDSVATGVALGVGILVQDVHGFGWDQCTFSSAKALSQLVQQRSLLMPEALGKILVVRAPSAWVYAWNSFKYLLDPGIREKVKVARPKDSLWLLRQYISDEQIPAYLGGSLRINGDAECRQVLAPGGLPPPEVITRFKALLLEGRRVRVSSADLDVADEHMTCGVCSRRAGRGCG
jgi:hypothetical protein